GEPAAASVVDVAARAVLSGRVARYRGAGVVLPDTGQAGGDAADRRLRAGCAGRRLVRLRGARGRPASGLELLRQLRPRLGTAGGRARRGGAIRPEPAARRARAARAGRRAAGGG